MFVSKYAGDSHRERDISAPSSTTINHIDRILMRKLLVLLLVGFVLLLSSCGDDDVRDDSWDRQQIQICLDNGGKPIYAQENTYDGIRVDFVACDKP